MRSSLTAALALASVAGTGIAATHQPTLWATGGQGSARGAAPLSDVVPTRPQQISKLQDSTASNPFDVLIIGGGATGTGCAVDAVTRGLRTALVERMDWASGTSSRSTKLVHGGVRYLEKAVFQLDLDQLKLVYEALHERATLLANAPHLAKPLPILTPCYKWWEVPYYWMGMKAYDLVAGRSTLVLSKYVSPAEAVTWLPTLAPSMAGRELKGGVLYYDGQFDDARLNVALACTAAAAGAALANYVECVRLIKNGEGQVTGARVRDTLSGKEWDVHAKVVINAAGPFVDNVRRLADKDASKTLAHSAGAHITLPAYYGSPTTGIIIPRTSDGRVVFLLPFQGHIIAGTTDVACPATPHPRASEDEFTYILATIRDYLGVKVSPGDVKSVWSGIRPLPVNPAAKKKDTQSIVRDHVIFTDDDGLLNVEGGKWTTYRRMAEETIDAAVSTGRLPLIVRPCVTANLPLLGAHGYSRTTVAEVSQEYCGASEAHDAPPSPPSTSPTPAGSAPAPPRGKQLPITPDTAAHLCQAYGDRAPAVLAIASSQGLHKPLATGHPHIEAEVVYCAQNEYCVHVSDFLARRSRLAFLDVAAARAAIPRVTALLARVHGWDSATSAREAADAHAYLTAEFTPGPIVE